VSLIQDVHREGVYAVPVASDGDKIMRMAAQPRRSKWALSISRRMRRLSGTRAGMEAA
jgi:hypothetical protein